MTTTPAFTTDPTVDIHARLAEVEAALQVANDKIARVEAYALSLDKYGPGKFTNTYRHVVSARIRAALTENMPASLTDHLTGLAKTESLFYRA